MLINSFVVFFAFMGRFKCLCMKLLFEEEKVAAGGHQVASLASLSKSNFVKIFCSSHVNNY